jgi:P-type Cu+ transporter
MHDHHNRPQVPSSGIGEATHMAKDPVCGANVDPRSANNSAEYGGQIYYFCSRGCKTKFAANPSSYIAAKPKPPAPASEDAIYTCPMHPEIRQTGPGNCPICGMALEPDVATAQEVANPELAGMTRRFWIALALSLPVVVLEMGGHLFKLHTLISEETSNWAQFVLATPVVLWAGWPFFERGARSLATRNLNMFTLIAMGTGVAWACSPPRHWRLVFFRNRSRRRRLGRDLFRGRRGHCSGRCWSSGLVNKPPKRSRRSSASRQRPRGVFAAITCRSMRSPQAKKCRLMERS